MFSARIRRSFFEINHVIDIFTENLLRRGYYSRPDGTMEKLFDNIIVHTVARRGRYEKILK